MNLTNNNNRSSSRAAVIVRRCRLLAIVCCFVFIVLASKTFRVPRTLWKYSRLTPRTEYMPPTTITIVKEPSLLCTDELYILVLVHTDPSHVKNRHFIRQTWGNPENYERKTKVLFLMAVSPFELVNKQVENEIVRYGDIVLGDFVESWKNLTYKSVMGLSWMVERCPHAKYLLKLDDDILVDAFRLLELLGSFTDSTKRSLICYVVEDLPLIRDKTARHYVSKTEYFDDRFVDYCSGAAYIIPGNLVPKLLISSKRVPLFKMEDVYITGMLAVDAGISHYKINHEYTFREETDWTRYQSSKTYHIIFTYHAKEEHLDTLWEHFKNHHQSKPTKMKRLS
ncbi:beta-1,3-galactosyltransferase 5-like isoform X2 [Tubulanus polymorphus]